MQSSSVLKVGVVCITVCILRQLLKELVIAVDTWLQIISYNVIHNSIPLKNKLFKFKTILYALLCGMKTCLHC